MVPLSIQLFLLKYSLMLNSVGLDDYEIIVWVTYFPAGKKEAGNISDFSPEKLVQTP